MANKNKVLAGAMVTSLGVAAGGAEAATYPAVLTATVSHARNSMPGNISSSTATWSYDDVTGLLSQTGGTFNVRYSISVQITLFRHSITGLVIGNGAPAAADMYTCSEGNYGGFVSGSLCGNYTFGANALEESTASWGPGTAYTRTVGGDDVSVGPQQSIAFYDGFSAVSWAGTTLTLSNGTCNPLGPDGANDCIFFGGFNEGYTWTLQVAPVPAPPAVWLLGTAVLALGGRRWMRRKVAR